MWAGLAARYRFGEVMAMEKGHALTLHLLLWPTGFLVLSGCYATLFRNGTSPLTASQMKR